MQLNLDKDIEKILIKKGYLLANNYILSKLTGGVSSNIFKIVSKNKTYCLKIPKHKLEVNQEWYAPLIRNSYEHQWYSAVSNIKKNITPKVYYFNNNPYFFIMEYLNNKNITLWKDDIFKFKIDNNFTKNVAINLAQIHSSTYGNSNMKSQFNTIKIFEELRIDPYIRSTSAIHDDVRNELLIIAKNLYKSEISLVHGDISPKNILNNSSNPIFLDAECAWFGDPAFDVAFCLSHIILKSFYLKKIKDKLILNFNIFSKSYIENITFTHSYEYEKRIVLILSSLLLARIDGKSPIEYITSDEDKNKIRFFSKSILKRPLNSFNEFIEKWQIK